MVLDATLPMNDNDDFSDCDESMLVESAKEVEMANYKAVNFAPNFENCNNIRYYIFLKMNFFKVL